MTRHESWLDNARARILIETRSVSEAKAAGSRIPRSRIPRRRFLMSRSLTNRLRRMEFHDQTTVRYQTAEHRSA
jgi:hypothetical protein